MQHDIVLRCWSGKRRSYHCIMKFFHRESTVPHCSSNINRRARILINFSLTYKAMNKVRGKKLTPVDISKKKSLSDKKKRVHTDRINQFPFNWIAVLLNFHYYEILYENSFNNSEEIFLEPNTSRLHVEFEYMCVRVCKCVYDAHRRVLYLKIFEAWQFILFYFSHSFFILSNTQSPSGARHTLGGFPLHRVLSGTQLGWAFFQAGPSVHIFFPFSLEIPSFHAAHSLFLPLYC